MLKPVDVTFENGIFHSVLKPTQGLINDLIRGLNQTNIAAITGPQVGHDVTAFGIKTAKGPVIIMNPQITKKSGGAGKYYKKVTIRYYSVSGRLQEHKLDRRLSYIVQEAMELLRLRTT